MRREVITLRDIALKMNLSISTISRVLRGMPDVNAETREAVLELAEKLHYEPNVVAQNLRSNRTHTIGVVVPRIAIHFFSKAISGIQDVASAAGYNVMICQTNETFIAEEANLRALISSRVDGLIISVSRETMGDHHFDQLEDSAIPTVFFDRILDTNDFSRVVVDDYVGAFKATEHLLEAGYRKIAHLAGPENLLISKDRIRGYKDALKKSGLYPQENLILHCEMLEESTDLAMRQLLEMSEPADAILCFNDHIAIKAIEIAQGMGISVPDQLGFVGFSNVPIGSYMTPSLTTVSQPAYEMGQLATKLILSEINTPDDFSPRRLVLKTELIIRDSSRGKRL